MSQILIAKRIDLFSRFKRFAVFPGRCTTIVSVLFNMFFVYLGWRRTWKIPKKKVQFTRQTPSAVAALIYSK